MKVAYVGALPGHGATTTNMIITAAMLSFNNHYRSVLFQCGDKADFLDQYLLGQNHNAAVNMVGEQEFPFYYGKGLDTLLKKVSIGKQIQRDEKALLSCCVEVIHGDCYFIPSSTKRNPFFYYNQMNRYIRDIVSWCNREFDITFIDNNSSDAELYSRVNDEADLVVINTSQNETAFGKAAELFHRTGRKKSLIMVGRYDNQCDSTVERLRHRFGLGKDTVYSICYDKKFLNALLSGSCIDYVRSCNDKLNQKKVKYYDDSFIKSLEAAYTGILSHMEALYAKKE